MRLGGSGVVGAVVAMLVMVGCGGGADEPLSGDDRIVRWQAQHEGADGMLATTDVLFVVGPEVVTAFDTSSGSVLWEAEMSDTSGVTPMALVDDVLVVAPDFEEVQAFDPATGASVTYSGPTPTEFYADFELPPGYAYTDGALAWDGTAIWSEGSDVPQVGRLGAMTIINDFETGLSVVSDRGEVVFHSETDDPFFDESAVLVDESNLVAFTLTADGTLWAIQAPR